MATYLSDTTVDTAGTLLENHTVSGAGATGGPWVKSTNTGGGFGPAPPSAVISNANRIRSVTGLGAATDLYMGSTAPATADYDVQASVYVATTNSNYVGICARAAGGSSPIRYKFGYIAGSPGVWALYKYDSGNNPTQIGGNVSSPAPAAGTTYTLKLRVQGTTITCFINGTSVISQTDSTIAAKGFPAIEFYSDSTDTTGIHLSNVLATDISSALAASTPSTSGVTSTGFTATGSASGGTPTYSYQWQQAPDVSGSAGTYVNVGTNSATYAASGLASSTIFWVRYTVTDTASGSVTSAGVSVTTLAGAGLTAAAATAGQPNINSATITAAPAGGTTPYSIQFQRAPDNAGAAGTYANTGTAGPATTYTDSTVTPGNTYWYRYVVTDSAGTPGTATSTGVKVRYPTRTLIVDGDSIAVGWPAVNDPGLYHAPSTLCVAADNSNALSQLLGFLNPAQTASSVGGDWCAYNVGFTGRPLAATAGDTNASGHTQQGDYAANVSGKISAAIAAGASKVVVLNIGEPTNQLYFCTLNGGAGGVLAQNAAISALQAYANGVRSAGAIFVTHTMLGRNQVASDAAFDADRLVINAWVRANWRSQLWGAMADIANDIRFGPVPPAGSSTWFADGIHPSTPAGYGEVARYLAGAVLEAVSSPNTGGAAGGGINGSEILGMA